MTTRPRLKLGGHLLPGLAAVALFALLAYVFWTAPFGASAGFPEAASITASIGYLMFDLNGQADVPGEGFLVAFEIVDVVLVAALVGAVMLARREADGEVATALGGADEEAEGAPEPEAPAAADGGRPRPDGGSAGPASGDGTEGGDR